ncbi:MAG: hypothetical protein JST79_00700 [Acidobacteria bacterium]|nr:hypothetical protein [Acidobacteriota bacterium]
MASKKHAVQEDRLTSFARSVGTTAGALVVKATQLTAAASAKASELAKPIQKKIKKTVAAKPAKKRVVAKRPAKKRAVKKSATKKRG